MQRKKNICYLHFDTLDSTNTWAKDNAHGLDSQQLTCITADEQIAGRGRRLKKWISPKGQNLYATFYFTVPKASEIVANLGQLLSLSCVSVLKRKGFCPQIKWPNDLLLFQKKVAGILCETLFVGEHLGVVLGIGINLNMAQELLEAIDQPATSLAQLSGQLWTCEQVLEPLMQQFLSDLAVLEEKGFEPFHAFYEEHLAFKGKEVCFQNGEKTQRGILHSISKEGRLNLLLPCGTLNAISAGELSYTDNA